MYEIKLILNNIIKSNSIVKQKISYYKKENYAKIKNYSKYNVKLISLVIYASLSATPIAPISQIEFSL